MNEKINSLRLDAGISTLENDPRLVVINKNGEVIDPMIGLEKFAELIILDCCDVIEQYRIIDDGMMPPPRVRIINRYEMYDYLVNLNE